MSLQATSSPPVLPLSTGSNLEPMRRRVKRFALVGMVVAMSVAYTLDDFVLFKALCHLLYELLTLQCSTPTS